MLPDPSRPGQPEARHASAATGRSSLVVIFATAVFALAATPAFADLAPDPDPGSSSPNPDPAPVATQPQSTPKPAPKAPQTEAAPAPPVRTPTQTVHHPTARRPAPERSPARVVAKTAAEAPAPAETPRRRHHKPAASKPVYITPAPAAAIRFPVQGVRHAAEALKKDDAPNAKPFAWAAVALLLLAVVSASLTWLVIQSDFTRAGRSL